MVLLLVEFLRWELATRLWRDRVEQLRGLVDQRGARGVTLPSIDYNRVMSRGIDKQSARILLDAVHTSGLDITALVRDPAMTAKSFGRTLTKEQSDRLKLLANLGAEFEGKRAIDLVDQEIVTAARSVVLDGRYVREFVSDPRAALTQLGTTLSPEAERRLASISGVMDPLLMEETDTRLLSMVITVVVVCAVYGCSDREAVRAIVDRSGVDKL